VGNHLQRVLAILCLVGVVLVQSGVGYAQSDDVSAAANAFSQAQRAELAGDFARAAELYELADSIAPTPEALRNATRAWSAANRPVGAATAAEELLRRYGSDPTSQKLAEDTLTRTRPQLGRFQVACSTPCTLTVDGLAVAGAARTAHTVYLQPGPHTLVAGFEGGESRKASLEARAGQASDVALTPDPSTAPRAPEPASTSATGGVSSASTAGDTRESSRKRLHPAYFWTGVGLTAALGAVTIWSGIDLLNARDDFKKDPTPTQKAFDAGENKDTRTTALIASTAVVAASTVVLAFFTDFKRRGASADSARALPSRLAGAQQRPSMFSVGSDGRGAQVLLRGAF
jgi:hypothetical protein